MFENLTEQARHVVVRAQEHARDLRHGYIGTEHLLLAVAGDGGKVPIELLGSFGVDLDAVRARVIERVGAGDERPGGLIPFTPRAKRALEMALRESLELDQSEITSGHLLLGLMRLRDGMAVRVLLDLNVPWDELRTGLRERLSASGSEEGLRLSQDARGPVPMHASNDDTAHVGPPDRYLVTRAASAAEVPADVRAMAEQAIVKFDLTFEDLAFIAEVRDADTTEAPAYPQWLIAMHGPSPHLGMIVRNSGSWASSSHRGSGGSEMRLAVHTFDRVEISTLPSSPE